MDQLKLLGADCGRRDFLRQADQHFEGAIAKVKDVITADAAIFALGPLSGG